MHPIPAHRSASKTTAPSQEEAASSSPAAPGALAGPRWWFPAAPPPPRTRVRSVGCAPRNIVSAAFMTQPDHAFLHERPRRPPEPTAPPRAHPPLPGDRGDALRFYSTPGMAESDRRPPLDLVVRRRGPRVARALGPLEDRIAGRPAP